MKECPICKRKLTEWTRRRACLRWSCQKAWNRQQSLKRYYNRKENKKPEKRYCKYCWIEIKHPNIICCSNPWCKAQRDADRTEKSNEKQKERRDQRIEKKRLLQAYNHPELGKVKHMTIWECEKEKLPQLVNITPEDHKKLKILERGLYKKYCNDR